MTICAIINVWSDSRELLKYSIYNKRLLGVGIVIIWSETSNYGEVTKDYLKIPLYELKDGAIDIFQWEPDLKRTPTQNETEKRNFGLECARKLGYTHFLNCDIDEFYRPEPFLKEIERFKNPNLNGLVCASQVYFKSPQLTIGLDTTRVTF